MNTEQLFAGGVLLGVLAAFWQQARLLAWRAVNLFVVSIRLESDVANAMAYYLWRRLQRSPFGERRYQSVHEFVRPVGRSQSVGFEAIGTDPAVFWNRLSPIVVRYTQDSSALNLTFIRFTFDAEKLVIEALDELNRIRHEGSDERSRFNVQRLFGHARLKYVRGGALSSMGGDDNETSPDKAANVSAEEIARRYLKWQREELGPDRGPADPFLALAFGPKVAEVVEETRRWKASEKWYRSRQIPWRRGLLFTGAPGTGKTSLAVAIARDLDLPVFAFDLASFDNEEFVRKWESSLGSAPCMVLLEDIDAVFDGRENRLGEQGGGLTFDCLLNCISGARNSDGVVIIITTNHPERLDEALGAPAENGMPPRPGRIDRALHLEELNEECRRQIARRILADCPDEIEALVSDGEGDVGAQFQERCARVALKRYWQGGNGCAARARQTA